MGAAIRNAPFLLIVISLVVEIHTPVKGMGAVRRIKIMMLVYATGNARSDTMDVVLSAGDPAITFVEKNMLTGALLVRHGLKPAKRGSIVEVLEAFLTNFGPKEMVVMDSMWIMKENVPRLISQQSCLVLFAAINNNNPFIMLLLPYH